MKGLVFDAVYRKLAIFLKVEKKRYKVTAVLKLLVVFALLGFFLSNKPMYHVQTVFLPETYGICIFWHVFGWYL